MLGHEGRDDQDDPLLGGWKPLGSAEGRADHGEPGKAPKVFPARDQPRGWPGNRELSYPLRPVEGQRMRGEILHFHIGGWCWVGGGVILRLPWLPLPWLPLPLLR